MVGTRKNARFAHVGMLQVERFRMREGRKGETPGGYAERVFSCIMSTCQGFSNCPPSPRLRFSCSSVSRDGGNFFLVSGLEFLAC